jgi:hypothetical protein
MNAAGKADTQGTEAKKQLVEEDMTESSRSAEEEDASSANTSPPIANGAAAAAPPGPDDDESKGAGIVLRAAQWLSKKSASNLPYGTQLRSKDRNCGSSATQCEINARSSDTSAVLGLGRSNMRRG